MCKYLHWPFHISVTSGFWTYTQVLIQCEQHLDTYQVTHENSISEPVNHRHCAQSIHSRNPFLCPLSSNYNELIDSSTLSTECNGAEGRRDRRRQTIGQQQKWTSIMTTDGGGWRTTAAGNKFISRLHFLSSCSDLRSVVNGRSQIPLRRRRTECHSFISKPSHSSDDYRNSSTIKGIRQTIVMALQYLSIHTSNHPPFQPSTLQTINHSSHLLIGPSIHPSTHTSFHPSIYPLLIRPCSIDTSTSLQPTSIPKTQHKQIHYKPAAHYRQRDDPFTNDRSTETTQSHVSFQSWKISVANSFYSN